MPYLNEWTIIPLLTLIAFICGCVVGWYIYK